MSSVAIVAVIVSISIVILILITIALYRCLKKLITDIGQELNTVASTHLIKTAPLISSPVRQVPEIDAPAIKEFLDKFAQEKPVQFSSQQLFAFTGNYSTLLGSGGFGKVYKGKLPNGVKIAVKVIGRGYNANESNIEEQFMAEVGTIGRTHHINLVRLYGFCYDNHVSALVYEFMENGSLDKYLFGEKNQELEWEKLHEISIGTAKGIAYLHEECQQRIVHYDIKPGNVLLDSNFLSKVADFGLAKLYNRDATHISVSGYRGTQGYAAPEFTQRNFPITYKCDVYSFGILLFDIVGRRKNARVGGNGDNLHRFLTHAWEDYEKGEIVKLIESYGIKEKDRDKANRMVMVALWCIQYSPEARPTMSSVVKMLEGGDEIMPPPKPFNDMFLVNDSMKNLALCSGSEYLTRERANSHKWYEEKTTTTTTTTTTTMDNYEIEIASP